ncbi:hypothetical protein JTB14_018125 [Gonioctena quinquepunctata]|nr:hypothetical protein JTB14_018125 [Gonioctena quinquepunctata]
MEINDDKIPDMQTCRELQKYENALRKEIFDKTYEDQCKLKNLDEELVKRWVPIIKSKQQNFEEIIGEDFNSEYYYSFKNLTKIQSLVWKQNTMENLMEKEFTYRINKHHRMIECITKIIQSKNIVRATIEIDKDPKYRKEYEKISEIWKSTNHTHWKKYRENRKLLEDRYYGKAPKKNTKTYSMGAQPSPTGQPLWETEKIPTPPIEESVEENTNHEEGHDVPPPQSYYSSNSSLTSLDEDKMKNHIEFVLSVNCRFGKLIGERYNSDIYEKIKKQMKIEQPEEFELLEQLEFKYVTGGKARNHHQRKKIQT